MSASGPDVKRVSLVSTTASSSCPFSLWLVLHCYFRRRHQALHAAKSQSNICQGCKKTFSRLDALNVRVFLCISPFHPFLIFCPSLSDTVSASPNLAYIFRSSDIFLFRTVRSDGGAECRASNPKFAASTSEENQPNTNTQAPTKEPIVS